MLHQLRRNMIGWLTVSLLLAGCQADSAAPPAVESTPTRIIEHAMGSSEVPVSPQRVVVLDTAPLDAALALGITPVGTAIYRQPPEYLSDRIADVAIIGDGNRPDLETILKLEPDLILGSKIGAEELYGRLSEIAPTVLTEDSGRSNDWQENLQLYAETLSRSKQAEQLLQNYRQRVQQLQSKIAQPQALKISVLIVYRDAIRAFTTGSFSGSILQDVGFARTPAQDDSEGYTRQLSAEALDTLDGDYIFLVYSRYRPHGIQKEEFVNNPVWSQLQAVQQERVCEVDGAIWTAGRNILAANEILTNIEACLASELEATETAE